MTNEELAERLERLESRYHIWRRTAIVTIAIVAIMGAYEVFAFARQPAAPQVPKAEPAKGAPAADAQVPIDVAGMKSTYVNFFRVTGNPDEVIIDLGLYSQVVDADNKVEPIRLNDRVVLNFVTAKKLRDVLNTVVERHEDAFGEIAVDPNKRLKPKR